MSLTGAQLLTAFSQFCPRCSDNKPMSDFYPDKRRGRSAYCKPCTADYVREYRQRRGPGYFKELNLRNRYGLSVADHDTLLEEQKSKCAICLTEMDNPYVDHDHETGAVRGLLCMKCNVLLGMAKDDAAILLRAVAYLEGGTRCP